MMKKTKKLREIATIINGFPFKGNDFCDSGVPVIKIKNVKPNQIVLDTLDYVSEETAAKAERALIKKGDILLTLTGNRIDGTPSSWVGKAAIFNLDGRYLLNQRVCIIRSITNEICNEFLAYYLSMWEIQTYFINHSNSSGGQANISPSTVYDLDIEYPSVEDQHKIVKVLNSMRDKYDLNNILYSKLEDYIRTNFKELFIDNKSSEWKHVPLSEVMFFQEGPGIRNWQYVTENGTNFINIRCINDGDIDTSNANMISKEESNGKYSHFMLKPYDIVMSCSGTLGRYAIVREEHLPLCLNTSVIRFRPLFEFDYSFVFGYLSSSEFLNQQKMMANGSAQVNFGPTHLKRIFIDFPNESLRKRFEMQTRPLIEKMINIKTENKKLLELRDLLLPKLICGLVDVTNIENEK